jgi:hypothetical protein
VISLTPEDEALIWTILEEYPEYKEIPAAQLRQMAAEVVAMQDAGPAS